MSKKIEFIKIDSNYLNYLRKYDSKVEYNQKELNKENRPHIGVLFNINNKKYYAPISSANKGKKIKYDRMFEKYIKSEIEPIDIVFIRNRQNKLISVINLNNMIPVKEENIIRYNIATDVNADLLLKEYKYCHTHQKYIREKAHKVYRIVKAHTNENLEKRCCNFVLLEIKCETYNQNIRREIMKNNNKPFRLKPIGKDYLWGGNRLKKEYNKEIDMEPLAETWECSTHNDGLSIVDSGEYKEKTLKEVLKKHPEYLGKYANKEGDLPIIVKLIDAQKDLSVQVHPTDEYAFKHEGGQLGKTEMWYVLRK